MKQSQTEVQIRLAQAKIVGQEIKENIKALSAQRKQEVESSKLIRQANKTARTVLKVEKTEARRQRMVNRVAKLQEMLAKTETIGKGNKAKKRSIRKPSAVVIISPEA